MFKSGSDYKSLSHSLLKKSSKLRFWNHIPTIRHVNDNLNLDYEWQGK